jgi:hypothetical protein
MCNCKGYDIAYYPEYITVEPHFCRLLDDCGHTDNTLEEAADEVASAYFREYNWYETMGDGEYEETYSLEYAQKLLDTANAWKNRTHESYLYYKNQNDY